jgi:hypothetical protein
MGYVNWLNGPLWAATKLLTSSAPANCYVVDNVTGGNGGVDVSTAFTTAQKYTVLSSPVRPADGFSATAGGDVMNCVSSGPFTINAGDSITVAFALIGGDNLADIQLTACHAQEKWDNTGACATGVNEVTVDNFWMDAYPNPASGNVNVSYNFTGDATASFSMINSLGETVMTIGNLSSGKNTLSIDVSKLSTGVYFYQMKAGEAVMTKKMTITR